MKSSLILWSSGDSGGSCFGHFGISQPFQKSAATQADSAAGFQGAQDNNLQRRGTRLISLASNASMRRGETGGTPVTPLHYL
jgi:hypothetical protein